VGWLTSRLSEPGTLVLPGAYDAYSALLVQRAGFEAVYASGYAAAASGYGLPDLGLLGLAEIAEALGWADFGADDFEEIMSTHYGRMVVLDDRVLMFANPEAAAEYISFDLHAQE